MLKLLHRQWFLLALVLVIAVGTLGARELEPFAQARRLHNAIVASVLFLMAWPLETGVLWETLRRPWPALLATLINAAGLPLMAWGYARLLSGDLATGLLVTSAVPCTLASASVWTRRAGGNDATSILVTLVTNAACFMVAPFWLVVMTGSQVHIEFAPMAWNLGWLVVAPMALGQILRHVTRSGRWATRRKIPLAVIAQLGILTMVLVGAIQSGVQLERASAGKSLALASYLWMELIVLALHLTAFGSGWFLSGLLAMPHRERAAVSIAGSQKTLMVGLVIAIQYYGGLTILPMVAYHVTQLLVDTLLADRMRRTAP
jgi:sodium/bile acid cotransporter 7